MGWTPFSFLSHLRKPDCRQGDIPHPFFVSIASTWLEWPMLMIMMIRPWGQLLCTGRCVASLCLLSVLLSSKLLLWLIIPSVLYVLCVSCFDTGTGERRRLWRRLPLGLSYPTACTCCTVPFGDDEPWFGAQAWEKDVINTAKGETLGDLLPSLLFSFFPSSLFALLPLKLPDWLFKGF